MCDSRIAGKALIHRQEQHMYKIINGEKTVRVNEYTFLGKCLKILPEKWHGLTDVESCYRQRYPDLIMSQKTKERFLLKSTITKELRRNLCKEYDCGCNHESIWNHKADF